MQACKYLFIKTHSYRHSFCILLKIHYSKRIEDKNGKFIIKMGMPFTQPEDQGNGSSSQPSNNSTRSSNNESEQFHLSTIHLEAPESKIPAVPGSEVKGVQNHTCDSKSSGDKESIESAGKTSH
ncbi:unnamed protein product [Allacma fusca]|uniref:Uncharacterized protein n=1 Tax=Allacma fusca TaxID=39272 RepID=A0A8J2K508_9HEXA|nr:unnamed protein product [Allacma fusca]